MATLASQFGQLNAQVRTRRSEVLEVIFTYLQLRDLKALMAYYNQPSIKQVLVEVEIDYLDSIANLYYGPEEGPEPPKKKSTH